MNKKEGISLLSFLEAVETDYWDKDSKVDLPKSLVYAIGRNIQKLTPTRKEIEEFWKGIQDVWRKEFKFDEDKYGKDKEYKKKADEDWKKYQLSEDVQKALETLLEENANVELHKVDDLEGCVVQSSWLTELDKLVK